MISSLLLHVNYCSQWWQRNSGGVCPYASIPLSFYGTVDFFFLFFSVSFFFFSLSHMYVYPRLNPVSFCEPANQSTINQQIKKSTSCATPADFVYSTIHHQRTNSTCINQSTAPPQQPDQLSMVNNATTITTTTNKQTTAQTLADVTNNLLQPNLELGAFCCDPLT
uniref:Uncharacterized protein n=1 Tax=Bactrocera latifrons TaxID=174628 RepID=A0A0K8WGL3_BACLA